MKKLCSIGFWFRSQYFRGLVFTRRQQAFSEYHVRLLEEKYSNVVDDYYFIEGYDGSLELNKAPLDLETKDFLLELSCVIEDVQKRLSFNKAGELSDHKVDFIPSTDLCPMPSAAA